MAIIWGSRTSSKEISTGRFYCPGCTAERPYRHNRFSRHFTLYFIPLFKTRNLGEYVECQICHRVYSPEVLRSSALPQTSEPLIHWEPGVETVLATPPERISVRTGAKVTLSRSRTVEHSVRIDTTAKAKANVSIEKLIKAALEGEFARTRGTGYRESETIEQTSELDGKQANEYTLTWFDYWRRGTIEYQDERGITQQVAFRFRESTELQVR
jgi:hypothetical protein